MKRGEDWGERSPVPDDAVWIDDDSSARALVANARRAHQTLPNLCLTGGDLARGLGGGRGRQRILSQGATHVRIDVGAVLLDGRLDWFIAHLVARRSWMRGRILVVANTDFIGKWNIAPRAHAGDGRLDLIDCDLSIGDRLKARRRLPSGAHLPHPAITSRSGAAFQIELDRPTPIHLDGQVVGRASKLSIRTEPETLDVWI